MVNLSFLTDNSLVPKPADSKRAARELSTWKQKAYTISQIESELSNFMLEITKNIESRAFLNAIFGNSPFLTQILQKDPAILALVHELGFDRSFADILDGLINTELWQKDRKSVMAGLRSAKHSCALITALADISNVWDLEKVCHNLSAFAELSISIGLKFLLLRASKNSQIILNSIEDPEFDCGISILALGKLGAKELNYSSDIDLMVLFDGEIINVIGKDNPQKFLNRMVRELVSIIAERTADGYVFRTDMRLRPDPSSTPLAVSTAAAEQYYESLGQNWERAAMIKARAVAGDQKVATHFLKRLKPFVWRKYLDFAAIEDIHSIKRQINAHKGHHQIAVSGHDIKVGRGGIREIEFFAQTQQLIWGGKEPNLRSGNTCEALLALANAGHAKTEAAKELVEAYEFLRKLEHRLQMIADEQTHLLPNDDVSLENLACFMHYESAHTLSEDIKMYLSTVERHYAALFEDSPALAGITGNLVFTGTEDDPDTLITLNELGFGDGKTISATIRGWHHGRIRATRSARARELLTQLMPTLLSAFSQTINPDAAFIRFDKFLQNLPTGIQLFSMFYARPGLLDSLAEIMGTAPSLAEHLGRHPNLLDGVLTGRFFEPVEDLNKLSDDLTNQLAQSDDYQDILDVTRRWTHDREFQIGMQLLRGNITGEESGNLLSDVAEATLDSIFPHVEEEFQRTHGQLLGGEFAIVGFGKLGGREITFSSDLDLVFIYRGKDPNIIESDGHRPLPISQYYGRLSQRLVSALNSLTPEGKLYKVDTRLRPSGSASPLASEIEGFSTYQKNSAWSWEHMALTRARVVAGSRTLAFDIEILIKDLLTQVRDPDQLRLDVIDMRNRINKNRYTSNVWKLKHVRGGLLDLEFIAQYFQLLKASNYPDIINSETDKVYMNLGKHGIINRNIAQELMTATKLLRRMQAMFRLMVGVERDEKLYPEGVRDALAKAAHAGTFLEAKNKVIETQQLVKHYYTALIENPNVNYNK